MGHKGQQEALRMSSEIQNYTNMYVNKELFTQIKELSLE